MTKSEALVRSIVGPIRWDIRPFCQAIELAAHLLFEEQLPREEILLIRDIYGVVAAYHSKQPATVAKQIERLSNLCLDALESRGLMAQYVGAPNPIIRSSGEIIFYLAYFYQFDRPYYEVARAQPDLSL